jgi:hypothetical protein
MLMKKVTTAVCNLFEFYPSQITAPPSSTKAMWGSSCAPAPGYTLISMFRYHNEYI